MLADDESILDDKRFISKFARGTTWPTVKQFLEYCSSLRICMRHWHNYAKAYEVGCHHDIIIVSRKSGSVDGRERSHFLSMAPRFIVVLPRAGVLQHALVHVEVSWFTGSRSAAITTTFSETRSHDVIDPSN
jgi:hypothetical protein